MFPLSHPLLPVYSKKAPKSQLAANLKSTSPQSLSSLQNGLQADSFQRSQSAVRFGSSQAPLDFSGDEDPDDPNQWLLASSHYTEEEEQPNPYPLNPDFGLFEFEEIEPLELAGLNMSTPKLPNSVFELPAQRECRGLPVENLAASTLGGGAKIARDRGDHAEADRLSALSSEKTPSTTGGPKKHQARPDAPESDLATSTLYKRAQAAKANDDHAGFERLSALARDKNASKTGRPKRHHARWGAPASDLSARGLWNKAKIARDRGNHEEADRLSALAREKTPSKTGGPKKRKGVRLGAPDSEFTSKTLFRKAREAKARGDDAESDRLSALASQKRQSETLQTQVESVQPRRMRSIFTPPREVGSHLKAHMQNHRPDLTPPDAGHQPNFNSTEPMGWQQAQSDDISGEGHYSQWNTQVYWHNQNQSG